MHAFLAPLEKEAERQAPSVSRLFKLFIYIPGAVSLQWSDHVDEDNMLLPASAIAEKPAAGLTRDMTGVIYDYTLSSRGLQAGYPGCWSIAAGAMYIY